MEIIRAIDPLIAGRKCGGVDKCNLAICLQNSILIRSFNLTTFSFVVRKLIPDSCGGLGLARKLALKMSYRENLAHRLRAVASFSSTPLFVVSIFATCQLLDNG